MGTINFHTSNINDGSVLSFRPDDKYVLGRQDIPDNKDLVDIISYMNENLEINIIDVLGSDMDMAYNMSKLFKINVDVGYYEGLAISLNYDGPSIEYMLMRDGYTPYDITSEIKMEKELGFNMEATNGRLNLNNNKMLEYVLNDSITSLILEKFDVEYMDGENYIDFIDRYSKYYNIPLDTPDIDEIITNKIGELSQDEFCDLIVNKLYKDETLSKFDITSKVRDVVNKYIYFIDVLAQKLGGEREYPGWVVKTEPINIKTNDKYDKEFNELYQDRISDISFDYLEYDFYDIEDLLDALKMFEQDLDDIERYIEGYSDTLNVRSITNTMTNKIVNDIKSNKYVNYKEDLFNIYFDEMISDDLYEICGEILSKDELEKLSINFYNYKEVIENIIEKAYNDESWML